MLWFQTWSCWASWFSSPSTMEAKRSLLFRSAAIVMAARILSRLGEDSGKVNRPDSTFDKVLSPHRQDIYSQFSAQTLCIFSCMLAQTFLRSLPQYFACRLDCLMQRDPILNESGVLIGWAFGWRWRYSLQENVSQPEIPGYLLSQGWSCKSVQTTEKL